MTIDGVLILLLFIILLFVIDLCTDQDDGSLCKTLKKHKKEVKKSKKNRLKHLKDRFSRKSG
jgi:hypothetical protein